MRMRAGTGSVPVRRAAGFTLLELVVALLIVSVMAAAAAPAFLADRPPPDLDDAHGRLEALFRMARDSAVRSATPVTVVIDSASGRVWLDARTPRSLELPPDPAPVPGQAVADGHVRLRTEGAFGGGSTLGRLRVEDGGAGGGEPLDLPASVAMQLFRARGLFTFEPSGAAAGDSILLRTGQGRVRLVTLDPWTGRVRAR